MVTEYLEKQECCGCMLCVEICPKNAIFEKRVSGFSFPEINRDKCIGCKKCVESCPVINSATLKAANPTINFDIASNKSLERIQCSSSGGVFIELASEIIQGGGIVYGAEFKTDWSIGHARADSENTVGRFRGSKYVQSSILECYNTILSDLNSGLTVLFSGTPCQIAAVKSFINHHKGYPGKLITVEILCYGVPSPQIFKEHINYIESKENSKVIKYSFRDRRSSWGQTYKHSAVLKNGKDLYNDKYLLAYTSLFSKRLIFRESCFSCKFTSQKRCADITIGDCWGVQDIAPECFDANGVSQVWTNTEEGHQLWDKVKPRFNTKTSTVNKLIPRNSVLYKSAEKPVDYNKFWKYYDKKGYEYILKRYTRFGKLYFIRRAAQKLMEKMHIRD